MATEKQMAANKRNAARSTGPRTPEGKEKSRMNARRHGLSYVADFSDFRENSDVTAFLTQISRRLQDLRLKRLEIVQIADYLLSSAEDPEAATKKMKEITALLRYENRLYTIRNNIEKKRKI